MTPAEDCIVLSNPPRGENLLHAGPAKDLYTRHFQKTSRAIDQAGLISQDHSLDAIAELEFVENMRNVGLDSGLGNVKPGCDLGVAVSTGNLPGHLELALG